MTSPRPDRHGITVRRAERADLLDVFRIEKASFPQPWPYSAFERFLGEPGFLVAAADGVVGYIVADLTSNHDRPIGHVKDLAVRPDERGDGVGRRLLEQGLGTLAVGGATLTKLEVRTDNEAAQSLYRDVGFEILRRVPRYYEDGDDALVMVLDMSEWRARRG